MRRSPAIALDSARFGWRPELRHPLSAPQHIRTEGWPGFDSGEGQRAFRLRTAAGGPVYFLEGNSGNFSIVISCDGNYGSCSGGKLAARYIVATQVDPNPLA